MLSINNKNQNVNFNGKVYFSGHWTDDMQYAFLRARRVIEQCRNNDIFAHAKRKTAYDSVHITGANLYQVDIGVYDDKSKINWLKDLFNWKKKSLTNNYHSETGTISRFDDLHFNQVF